jgi:predicted transcriptional regulator
MVRTQIQLPEELARRIREVADHQHTSMAEVIRRAVSFFFEASPQVDRTARYERAAAAAGAFSSGRSDLSRRHDRHFAEAARSRRDAEDDADRNPGIARQAPFLDQASDG